MSVNWQALQHWHESAGQAWGSCSLTEPRQELERQAAAGRQALGHGRWAHSMHTGMRELEALSGVCAVVPLLPLLLTTATGTTATGTAAGTGAAAASSRPITGSRSSVG